MARAPAISSQFELLFNLVKGVVADLVAAAHGEDRVACGLQRASADFIVRGLDAASLLRRSPARKTRPQFLTDRVGNSGALVRKGSKRRLQRALARRVRLLANRIFVMQPERSHERFQGQTLDDERAKDD
jgi:hypothetical protein